MKRKEFNDLKTKEIKELKKMVTLKKLEADKHKMQIMGGKEKNLKSTNNLRHDIAQILTVIREKEIIDKLESKEVVKEGKK